MGVKTTLLWESACQRWWWMRPDDHVAVAVGDGGDDGEVENHRQISLQRLLRGHLRQAESHDCSVSVSWTVRNHRS